MVFCFLDNYIIPFLVFRVNPFYFFVLFPVVEYDDSCRREDSLRRPIVFFSQTIHINKVKGRKCSAQPYREDQNEEGCRSFASQTGGKAPSPPSSPSFVCLGLAAAASPIREGGRQMPFPPTAFGCPTLRPTSPPVCPRSPSGFPVSGFRFPLFVCFGGGGARSVWAGLGPLPAPLPGFGWVRGWRVLGVSWSCCRSPLSRSCLSWAFVLGCVLGVRLACSAVGVGFRCEYLPR